MRDPVYNGVLTLADTDADTNTDKKWVVENCVMFIPTPTQMQLGFKPIVSVLVSVKVKSVSVSGSVNTVYVWYK